MSERPRTDFVPELEATRGIAALMVAGAHAAYASMSWDAAARPVMTVALDLGGVDAAAAYILRAVMNSYGAVLFFFVLSGFVLTASLTRMASVSAGRQAWRFVIARIFRIYPAIWATILLFVVWQAISDRALGPMLRFDGSWIPAVLQNMALLSTAMNGVMWSVQTELLAVPILFGGYLLARRFGPWTALVMTAVLFALSFQTWWLDLVPAPGALPRTQFLYAFPLGSAVFWYGRGLADRLPKVVVPFALIAALMLFLLPGAISSPDPLQMAVRPALEVLASGAIVLLVAYAPKGRHNNILGLAPIRFLGRVSYSFYLIHPLMLTVIWHIPNNLGRAAEAGVPLTILMLALIVGSCALALAFSWLCYEYVEQPGIRLGRLVLGKPSVRPVPSVAARRDVPLSMPRSG